MTKPITERFGAVTAKMQAAAKIAEPEARANLSRFRRREASEQDVAETSTRPDIENSALFKILTDSTIDPKEKAEKIAALLFFNEEDLEANEKALVETQAVISQILKDFTEHNKESIKLTRDNPLSELRTGIRDVVDEYHTLVSGRKELQDKLILIDDIISKHGGAEGLIKALLSAKDKQAEKETLDKEVHIEQEKVEKINQDVRRLDTSAAAVRSMIADSESDRLLFFKGEKKRKLATDKAERARVEAELTMKRQDMTVANSALSVKVNALDTFTSGEEYKVHQQILEILDIGTQEFKEKLKALSEVTLSYIDNTSLTLEGVGNQLDKLLKRVIGTHNTTHNTVENVSILLDAQEQAQKQNTLKLKELEVGEAETGVAAMKKEKKLRALHQHVSAVERTTQSTATVAGQLSKVEIGLTNFRDQMQEGVAEAMEQQMLAVTSAATTGNATLMRIETLATFVQGLVTKGQYMQESEYHLGEIAKEMERSLMGRLAKNEGIKNMADVLKEMTDAMDERNDVVLKIAGDKKELLDRLIDQTRQLARTNEESMSIESTVNRQMYDIDVSKNGQPQVAGPATPAMG